MSIKSVRAAVTSALSDKKVSLAEAEKITQVAGRTGGISATERKEIAKALAAPKFEAGAKAHLAANAAPGPTKTTPTVKALEQIVNAKGLDSISNLKDANEDAFSPALMAGLEKFASLNGNLDGDTLAQGARELVVGKEKLYVVTDLDWETNKERVGFFNKTGEEVGRAVVAKKKDDSMAMNWEALGGAPKKSPIGTPSSHAAETFPPNFKKDLEKWVEEMNGDDLGKRVELDTLPAEVRRQYEFIVRNASDSTGAEKINFKGKTIYALHDFSSVTSSYFFTESGTPLLSTNNG